MKIIWFCRNRAEGQTAGQSHYESGDPKIVGPGAAPEGIVTITTKTIIGI